jgi:3-oxoacyl-[acyl-carrier protein] reductase
MSWSTAPESTTSSLWPRLHLRDMRRVYDVNVIGLLTITQAVLARMPGGGRIINIGSRAYLGSPNHAHYVASKAAVAGLTRTLVLELAARQITVNAVAPGPVAPRCSTRSPPSGSLRQPPHNPGGQLPEPEDVAQAVAFFADPATRFINGQILLLDGGRSAGLSPRLTARPDVPFTDPLTPRPRR